MKGVRGGNTRSGKPDARKSAGPTKPGDIVKELMERGMSRRSFMRLTAGAGILLSVGHIFQGCGTRSSGAGQEVRTYTFDLSHADAAKDYYVVAGGNRCKLSTATASVLKKLRVDKPSLSDVSDSRITHYVDGALFPQDTHQLCYVQSVKPGSSEWRVEAMFVHIPQAFERSLVAYQAKNGACAASQSRKFSSRSAAAVKAVSPRDDLTDFCAQYDYDADYKNAFDTAKTLIFHHPDIMSLDTGTATYILNNIVCSRVETLNLAVSIYRQLQNGGSWAVQTPIIDDSTGKPYKNTSGQDQYSITWTDETNLWVGRAVIAIQKVLKNDTSLGANVTDRTSGGQPPGANADLKGKLWLMRDGVPSAVAPSGSSAQFARLHARAKADAAAFDYTLTNQSTERGFHIPSFSTDPATRQVTVEARNWYARYLGLYVRYLDADGNALAPPAEVARSLSDWQKKHSGTYDTLWGVIEPEMVIMGVPVKDFDHTFSFPVPTAASSLMIVAGGLGTGHTDYIDTLSVGTCATVIVSMAIPMLFLMSAAASAYSSFASDIDSTTVSLIAITFAPIMDGITYSETNDSHVFMNLASAVAGVLLKKLVLGGMEFLAEKIFTRIVAGQVIDAIPFVGGIISAIAAAGTAAQIGETVAEVNRSPKTFDYKMVFTHDVTVTINHDPEDTSGFPTTAATYEVIALLDKSTVRRSGRLPLTTFRINQFSHTFTGIPYGGKVKFSVGFFAENGWAAGQGQTEEIDNIVPSAAITITENHVPLTAQTTYWHLQKTALNAAGGIAWNGNHQSPALAPTAKKNALSCSNLTGSLCSSGRITASETYAAIGYTWQSNSSAITGCGGAGTGQLYQMRTLSLLDNPESSEIVSGCGSRLPFGMVFSLMAKSNDNYYLDSTSGSNHIRRIMFTAPGQAATYDAPGSNRSFGRLTLPSDGLLLHPLRKLISINRELSVVEILNLPAAAVADSAAPAATTASGEGDRVGLVFNPACAAMTADGTILVLESGNSRVQAFDTGMNPVKLFNKKTEYTFPLKAETEDVQYLDMAIEYAGYAYILSYAVTSNIYRLDIYDPTGAWLSRTVNVNAAALTIDFWRNVYTLNYETLTARGITSPSVSLWIPSVPPPGT